MAKTLNIFPTSVYTDMVYLNDDVMEKVKNFEYERMPSNNGCYTTDKKILDSLPEIKNQIQKAVDFHIHEVLGIVDRQKFVFQGSWINRHRHMDWAQKHDHGNAILSGVLFLDVPENSGDFLIHREHMIFAPNAIRFTYKEENIYNTYTTKFVPKKGGLIIFPSWMIHSVSENKTKENRYSLAFNLYPRGTFGQGDHILNL